MHCVRLQVNIRVYQKPKIKTILFYPRVVIFVLYRIEVGFARPLFLFLQSIEPLISGENHCSFHKQIADLLLRAFGMIFPTAHIDFYIDIGRVV